MNAVPASRFTLSGVQVITLLLIIVSLVRLAMVLPAWSSGVSPTFPGLYERRLLGALTSVPLLGAVFLLQPRGAAGPTPFRRKVAWMLLAVSVSALLVNVSRA